MSDHLLSYGHAAIYSQKAFQLLERLGWDRADTVLPHLVPAIVWGTREDTLPYMRPFTRALGTDPGPDADRPALGAKDGIGLRGGPGEELQLEVTDAVGGRRHLEWVLPLEVLEVGHAALHDAPGDETQRGGQGEAGDRAAS